MAKKKLIKAKSGAERQKAYRTKKVVQGFKTVEIMLSPATLRKLDRLAKKADLSRHELVAQLVSEK